MVADSAILMTQVCAEFNVVQRYVPNLLSQSALSFVTSINIAFVHVAYILKKKMHCNVFQLQIENVWLKAK